MWTPYNLIDSLSQIIDYTISDDQKNLELLIVVVARICFTNVVYCFNNWSKMSWAIQINILQTILVISNHFLQVVDSGVKNIAIQCKAMWCSLHVRRDSTSETKQIDFFFRVVELQDPAYLLNHLQVLVFSHVEIMQWVGVGRVTIT